MLTSLNSHISRLTCWFKVGWRELWPQCAEDLQTFLQGCEHVFLDVGANRGTHMRKLFEPEKYPFAQYLPSHDKSFGDAAWRRQPSSTTGICAVGVEPNPRFAAAHTAITAVYALQGWKVKFLPIAAGDHEGVLSMRTSASEDSFSEWGFSAYHEADADYEMVKEVRVAPLSDVIAQINVSVPSGIRLMKMDIEGSEYDVIPDLLKKGFLCQNTIGTLTIEWHSSSTAYHWTPEQLVRFHEIEHLSSNHECKGSTPTTVQEIDDESYLGDGAPLPPPQA